VAGGGGRGAAGKCKIGRPRTSQWATWCLQPIAELLAEEASEKLGAAVEVDVLTPLQAFDQGGSARALSYDREKAGRSPALTGERRSHCKGASGRLSVRR
jgi:hypothetical protein